MLKTKSMPNSLPSVWRPWNAASNADCRDDAEPGSRWDLKWLRPLNGALISDALLQTQDRRLNGRFGLMCPRFRINAVNGAVGNRIVDVSIIHMPQDPDVLDGRILHIYRLTLAEKNEFLPLALCYLDTLNLLDNPERILDGNVHAVVLFNRMTDVDGIPVPLEIRSFNFPGNANAPFSIYRAERVEVEMTGKESESMNWSILSSAKPDVTQVVSFIIERDLVLTFAHKTDTLLSS